MSYLDFAKEFMKQAGVIFKKYSRANKNTQYKEDTTPVTMADLEINDLLIAMVQKYFPDHAVMGEEASDIKEAEYVWVCDPVDGTVPYSRNLSISTICLSLLKNGISMLGVIYDPIGEILYI
ncbi:MAG: inositol monophosphatase family protein [bacterium]